MVVMLACGRKGSPHVERRRLEMLGGNASMSGGLAVLGAL
jgi:hypothetical protein